MKFIPKYGKSDKDIKTLRQEIGILKTLNHENIILMFDAFESDREFCVVTEYAQGELFDILQDDKKLPEATIQKVAKGLVKALHYLHSKRIIHRDMKPQNVLIGPNGVVKLCDFGFARAMSNNTIVLTSIKGNNYCTVLNTFQKKYDDCIKKFNVHMYSIYNKIRFLLNINFNCYLLLLIFTISNIDYFYTLILLLFYNSTII